MRQTRAPRNRRQREVNANAEIRALWAVPVLFPQARGFHHRGPALALAFDVRAEILRRAAERLNGLSLQRADDLVRLERLVGGARQLVDDRLRRADRRFD